MKQTNKKEKTIKQPPPPNKNPQSKHKFTIKQASVNNKCKAKDNKPNQNLQNTDKKYLFL
jgi:hypothetical protein